MDKDVFMEIEKLILHKKLVFDSCLKMSKYLIEKNNNELAIELMRRAVEHDNSKMDDDELFALSKINNSENNLKDPNSEMPSEIKEIIKGHWSKNRHHPEFHNDINKMDEIDILEMCCDWHARSVQYGTDLIEFVKIRQNNRFKFNNIIYNKIIEYCNVLIKN